MGSTSRQPIQPHRKVIGDAIRRYRKEAGLTQETLAERVDLNWRYVGEVERGEKIISIEALLRIAKAVDVPISRFFQGL
ncbi:MAG: helix-turn-helix transcriptional regulator [Verrucomicrobiae bacterium]|nr:helix-turn-helix transcriptional regulator [Verrucomicrobiae bacterium]